MQLIGVPICPYCHKRVNMIRVWNLKKHGEYRCPRCHGISNIYLSPLIYVFAFMAIAAGFVVYFFARFITESLGLMTLLYVFIPFAAFFILSLFFVYLQKPEIKRVRKTADGRYFDEDGNELVMRHGKLKPTGRRSNAYQEPEQQNDFLVDDSDSYGQDEYYDDDYDNGNYNDGNDSYNGGYDDNYDDYGYGDNGNYDNYDNDSYNDEYDDGGYNEDYSGTYEDDVITPPSTDLPMPSVDDDYDYGSYDDSNMSDEEAFYAEASKQAKEKSNGKKFSRRF